MKRALSTVFIMFLSIFVFSSCSHFDPYMLDVFGLVTPVVLQMTPEEVFDHGIDDILDAEEYELKITSYTDYTVVGELSGIKLRDVPSDTTEYMVVKESGESVHLEIDYKFHDSLGAERAETVSLIYVDGMLYIDDHGIREKKEVSRDDKEINESAIYKAMDTVTKLLFFAYKPDGDNFNGVELVKDGDLYKMEMDFVTREPFQVIPQNSSGGFSLGRANGKLSAYFDGNGNLTNYELALEAEARGLHVSTKYEIECDISETEISPPANADSYS